MKEWKKRRCPHHILPTWLGQTRELTAVSQWYTSPSAPEHAPGIHQSLCDTGAEIVKCKLYHACQLIIWAASSEFVSSNIPSRQVSTAHAQPFRGARDLAFCLKVPLDSLLVWASSEGSGETARMRRLAWTFAARIGDKYQIRLTRPIWCCYFCGIMSDHENSMTLCHITLRYSINDMMPSMTMLCILLL